MISTLTVLDDLVARLKNTVKDANIALHPDEINNDYYYFKHPKAEILIGYEHGKFSDPVDTAAIAQKRTLTFFAFIKARKLNTVSGTYRYVDQVCKSLMNYSPVSCEPIWLVEDRFAACEGGIWVHKINFATNTLCVPDIFNSDHSFSEINYSEQEI